MRYALRGAIVVAVAAILGTGIASATLFAGANVRAPAGFRAAVFTVAKGTYYLADGRRLTRTLDGSCRVSG